MKLPSLFTIILYIYINKLIPNSRSINVNVLSLAGYLPVNHNQSSLTTPLVVLLSRLYSFFSLLIVFLSLFHLISVLLSRSCSPLCLSINFLATFCAPFNDTVNYISTPHTLCTHSHTHSHSLYPLCTFTIVFVIKLH